MKILQQIVYLNIIVAFSTAVLSGGILYRVGVENWYFYSLLAFLSTMTVYNGQRLFKAKTSKQTPWLSWVTRNRNALIVLVVTCGIGASVILLWILNDSIESMAVLGLSTLFAVFYVVRVFGINLRELPYVKIHLIAISWVMVLIAFPMINERVDTNLFLILIVHYIYLVSVAIPFDIRDLKYDLPSQKTVPQLLGVRNSIVFAVLMMILFTGLVLFNFQGMRLNPIFYLAVIIQAGLILFMNENRSDIYCAGAIDGSISLLGLSYFII